MTESNAGSARAVIEQIWYRARINAFAHRAAAEEASTQATKYFRRELISALLAILCIILVYLFLTSVEAKTTLGPGKAGVVSLTFTFLSIIFTLYSLFESVMANYMKFDVRAARHEHLLNSFQFLAQRAREVKWPDLPPEKVLALLDDLEREFALLKATGTEPRDSHFEVAHALVKKIRSENETRIAQSFEVGSIDEIAQHAGDPVTSK